MYKKCIIRKTMIMLRDTYVKNQTRDTKYIYYITNYKHKYITTALCTTYRAPKVKTLPQTGYAINKRNPVDDKIQVGPDIPMRVTRSLKKLLDNFHDFIILENYRCMPLLGDEENVPNWDVHIVRYSIVYVDKETAKT